MENWKGPYFEFLGSIFDDVTTDRKISTRSIDLSRQFDFAIYRVLRVGFQSKAPNLKAESQANLISKKRAPEDTSISRYENIEIPPKMVVCVFKKVVVFSYPKPKFTRYLFSPPGPKFTCYLFFSPPPIPNLHTFFFVGKNKKIACAKIKRQ